MPKDQEHLREEHGQSLVEMAVIVPFLLILLIGVIEISQAFVTYIALINAAREGAVFASTHPDIWDSTKVAEDSELYLTYLDRVDAEALSLHLDPALMAINRPVLRSSSDTGTNCPITVTLSYQLSTFSSGIHLPLVNRLGLPASYLIRYSFGIPIREAETTCYISP